MWRTGISLLMCALAVGGCTTKSKAKTQAQSAFMAGRLQALQQQSQQMQQQAQGTPAPAPPGAANTVSILGEVANPVILWSPGLTLAGAIVAAEFRGAADPKLILIVRNGQAFKVNPRQLLDGVIDPALEPGDVIELRE